MHLKQRHHYSPVIYEERRLFDEAMLAHALHNRGRRQLGRAVRLARGTRSRDVCMANASHRSARQLQLDQSPIPGPGPYVYAVFRSCSQRGVIARKPNLRHVLHFTASQKKRRIASEAPRKALTRWCSCEHTWARE